MTDNDLDRLLSTPLPPVEDTGFSHGVMAHVAAAQQRRMLLETVAIVLGVTLLLAFLPVAPLAKAIQAASLNLATSEAVAVAIAALVLSNFLARSDRLG
jgi:hypothetical protein